MWGKFLAIDEGNLRLEVVSFFRITGRNYPYFEIWKYRKIGIIAQYVTTGKRYRLDNIDILVGLRLSFIICTLLVGGQYWLLCTEIVSWTVQKEKNYNKINILGGDRKLIKLLCSKDRPARLDRPESGTIIKPMISIYTSLQVFKIFNLLLKYVMSRKFCFASCPNLSFYQWLDRSASISVSPNTNLNCINAGTAAGSVSRSAVRSSQQSEFYISFKN